jgi:hypothetical protein
MSAASIKRDGTNLNIEIDAFVCWFDSGIKFAVEKVDITYGI